MNSRQEALDQAPRFVGVGEAGGQVSPETSFAYMTAPEMQSKVQALTGYWHPAFDSYADVLGRYDARTGQRTNDRPSLITVFFMQNIAASVAGAVVARERFLDDDERIVYRGVDLDASPDDAALGRVVDRLHGDWLGKPASEASAAELVAGFRRAETAAEGVPGAYVWLTTMMIRHGGLYYY